MNPIMGWTVFVRRGWGLLWQAGLAVCLLTMLSGCGAFGCRACARVNDPIPIPESGEVRCTRATLSGLTPELLPNSVFVGIAMSGGGSRAANFSSAVLLELQKMGILQQAAVISSVSGSSLVNAYYGRYGDSDSHWSEAELRRRMGSNLQTQWESRWLWPQNILRYWFTVYDRSDIMKEVFDYVLFDGTYATFADMKTRSCGTPANPVAKPDLMLPAIVINATTLSGQNFVFTDESFRTRLNSRLDTFPLSHAIMASAAFPGVFQNVTLQDYSWQGEQYLHLFDGGPSDNLGVEALQEAVRALDAKTREGHQALQGCMMILVDSFTNVARRREEEASRKTDTRKLLDFIVDDNFANAVDAMLSHRREDSLQAMGYPFEDFPGIDLNTAIGKRAYWSYQPLRLVRNAAQPDLVCHVWHLTFQRLDYLASKAGGMSALPVDVNEISTQFRLGGVLGNQVGRDENALYEAARILTQDDQEARGEAMKQLQEWGLIR